MQSTDCCGLRDLMSHHAGHDRLVLGRAALVLLAGELPVRQEHDSVKNGPNEQRAENETHEGRAGVAAFSVLSAHDC